MNLASSILGSTAVKYLRDSASAHVLRVGTDTLTRGQLAAVQCYNFHAARLLTNVLNEHIKAPNLRYVFEKVPPLALALPNVGSISLAVLGAAFEAKRIGGETPLENYVKKHTTKTNGEANFVTWSTLKHRDQAETARENKERKKRKRQRRNKAHEIRVDRFEERTAQQIAEGKPN
jgi:hypothetical protein